MNFSKYMRHVKFGRSLIAIFLSAIVMFATFHLTDPVIDTFQVRGKKIIFIGDITYLVMHDTKGEEYRTRRHDVLDSYVNKGNRDFVCEKYRSSSVECGILIKK